MTPGAAVDDLWRKTFRRDPVPGLPHISVFSVVNEAPSGRRYCLSKMSLGTGGAIHFEAGAEMTPDQMRGLAALLAAHAERVEHELMPLLQAEPGTPPATLYREPEAA